MVPAMIDKTRFVAFVSVAVLVVSACTASGEFSIGKEPIENVAEDLIEGDLADQLDLGELDASCNDPADEEPGTTFLCTASTDDDEVVQFEARIDDDDQVFVVSKNALTAKDVAATTAIIRDQVLDVTGVEVAEDAIDCGDGTILLDASQQIACVITDPDGVSWDMTVTFDGVGTDDTTFEWQIADQPRS